ncbi:MAG: hypothetical protein F4Z24_04960 [Nitrospira sp. SB0666_bin_27]|nr:hypothetical protein [Nitrospira sp. SB0666_bin_27]MYF24207.1 hypothetical protein [Nitrospira sp. SB0678_bin_10]
MSKWPMVRLERLAVPIERPAIPIPGISYRQIGVKLWGEGVYQREAIDGGATKYKKLSRVEADDVIVNKIWARNGSVALVPTSLAGSYVSSEFPTFHPIREKLEPRWVHWITKTKFFWDQCNDKSRGTSGKNRIRPERFLEIEIPLPRPAEQRRIVTRIETLAAKIEEAQLIRGEVIEEADRVVSIKARKILGTIIEPVTELEKWLDSSRDGIQTGPFGAQLNSQEFQDSGVPVLTIRNVQYGGLDVSGTKYVSKDKARQLTRYAVQEGDILFARMGTVGRCCIVPRESDGWLINYHIIRVALNRSRVEPKFIHWTLRCSENVKAYLEENIRGATREGVNSKIVSSLPCRVPSLSKQRRIVAYLDNLQAKVGGLKQLQTESAAQLDALLPSILDKAFNGEL